MPKKTIQDKTAEMLEALDCKEVESRSSKYRVFIHRNTRHKVFVGRRGAVRFGRCATASQTIGGDRKRTLAYISHLVTR